MRCCLLIAIIHIRFTVKRVKIKRKLVNKMKNFVRLLLFSFGFMLLGACANTPPPAVATPAPTPTAKVGILALPTPLLPGAEVIYKDLRVTVKQAEITGSYLTEYGSSRQPPAQQQFLWVPVLIVNNGTQERALPAAEHFSVLYSKSEFKPSYGHRQGFVDYTTLKPVVYPGQVVDAWLRFEIPATASLQDLQLAFLPESIQVNLVNPDNGYAWADHQINLWRLAP